MNKKGFTLVELLSVIAILAILIVLVLPNVLKLFNKSKKDIFVTEIKLIVKESNSHWMKDSLLNSQAAVYSKCVDDNCENQLDITARDILSYYVEMNALGKITKLYVSDSTYQYGLESNEIKLEDIDENAVEEINEENKIVIFCTGISNVGSEIIDDGSDITDGIRVTFNANGGSVSIPGKNYHLNSNYNTLPKPTRSGYTFLGWSTLPNGYQELEYIETTGTQYIDTGVYANEKTGFEIDFTTSDNFNTYSFGAIFGSVDNYAGSTATNRMEYGTWTGRDSSGYLFFGKSVKDANAVAAKLSKNNRLKASFINGVYKSPTGTTANIDTEPFTSQNSLLLFARRWTNNQIQYYSHIKLYSFKIFNGDKLIKYFIPCLKKDDKVVGLYDVIGKLP